MEAVIEKRHSLALGAFVSVFFGYQRFDLLCEQTADRCFASSSKNFCLPQYLPGKAYSHILFLLVPGRHLFKNLTISACHVSYVLHALYVALADDIPELCLFD
jgi:hypothetical protein